ncbi:Uncharacterized protein APZ42_025719 [Daphnia magna]|uniref:Uncharacterized protein n=1 Tax=Daphnia magna TaxID=35525 RepID=A0A0P5UC27_9CRUS|nr:Uncharacterized protein APZ42_025719 [Daphnia magna]
MLLQHSSVICPRFLSSPATGSILKLFKFWWIIDILSNKSATESHQPVPFVSLGCASAMCARVLCVCTTPCFF